MKKKLEKDRKRKSTELEKADRRKRKYAKTNDDSLSARRAYSCHNEGESSLMMFPLNTLRK